MTAKIKARLAAAGAAVLGLLYVDHEYGRAAAAALLAVVLLAVFGLVYATRPVPVGSLRAEQVGREQVAATAARGQARSPYDPAPFAAPPVTGEVAGWYRRLALEMAEAGVGSTDGTPPDPEAVETVAALIRRVGPMPQVVTP